MVVTWEMRLTTDICNFEEVKFFSEFNGNDQHGTEVVVLETERCSPGRGVR
jgi:hypothetical protein